MGWLAKRTAGASTVEWSLTAEGRTNAEVLFPEDVLAASAAAKDANAKKEDKAA